MRSIRTIGPGQPRPGLAELLLEIASTSVTEHDAEALLRGVCGRLTQLVGLAGCAAVVPLARTRWLRSGFRLIRQPLVALPIYVLVLYGWHYAPLFDAAVEHPLVHALQHWMFFATSMLVWWSVVEPKRRRVSGELWKAGHLIGMRLAGMFLGMAFILMRVQAYPWYGDRAHAHGLDPIRDQQYGGGIMFLVDLLVMFFALGFFFWRAASDADEAERQVAEERRLAAAR